MEFLKIVFGCILAAVLYGIVHDQFTARICLEYFTVFHQSVFPTQSPTLLALGWGVIATWWVGAILGIALACSARLGDRMKLAFRDLSGPIVTLLGTMACAAILSGVIGYISGVVPGGLGPEIPSQIRHRFAADLWAHGASYLVGFAGGIVLSVLSYKRRGQMR